VDFAEEHFLVHMSRGMLDERATERGKRESEHMERDRERCRVNNLKESSF